MARSIGASTSIFVVDHTNPGPRPLTHADTTDDAQFLVAALLHKRRYRGVTQYLVSWKGDWSAAEKTSWVDEEDVSEDIIRDFMASGIILPPISDSNVYRSETTSSVYDDEDEMDISSDDGSDDSGSEYDSDDDEDDDEMDLDIDDNIDKPARTRLPNNSSVKSDRAASVSEQHDHRSCSPSPVPASQAEEIDEVHNRALLGAALEAKARADLDALDAAWKAHGDTLTFGQSLAPMEPITQQPSQGLTASPTGFVFDPIVNTVPLPVETFRQGPAMMQPVLAQPDQISMVSQTGFAFDPMLTTEGDAYTAEFLDFKATVGNHYSDSEEDAEGSVISEGEQARYDAMSAWPRM